MKICNISHCFHVIRVGLFCWVLHFQLNHQLEKLIVGFLSQSVQMGNTTKDFLKKKGIYTQGNTYSRWIVRSHWNNQMKGNVFEYIGGIVYSKWCTRQGVSGSQLAKSKTEIGAMSQRAVNLDRALWEMIAFPFLVVLEMQPSYCYLRKVSRIHFDKICKSIYVEKKKKLKGKEKQVFLRVLMQHDSFYQVTVIIKVALN